MRRNQQDAGAHMTLATLYARAGKMPEAAHELRATIQIAPNSAEAHRSLSAIYHQAGYMDHEMEELVATVKSDPNDAEAALHLADLYLQLEWFSQAEQALAVAAQAAPNEPRVAIAQATMYFMQRRYADMGRIVQDGLSRWPQNAVLTALQSEVIRQQNHLPQAEQFLRQAIALTSDPSLQVQYDTNLARLLLDSGWQPPRYADAEQAARSALRIDAGDLEAHYWLGRALESQGRTDAAGAQYAITAKQDSRYEGVALYLGRIYQRSSDPAKRAEGNRLIAHYTAEEASARGFGQAREDLRDHFNSPDAHLKVALGYIKSNLYPMAIVELRRTLQLRPGDTTARRQLIRALKATGRNTEAATYAKTGYRE